MYGLHKVNVEFLDRLSDSFTNRTPVKLSEFRAEISNTDDVECFQDVLFFGQDGNDYAITYDGMIYTLIVLDNDSKVDRGEVIGMHGFETYKDALHELFMISLTDTEN